MIIHMIGWNLLKSKHTKAFSYIEVLVSLFIISILSFVLYFSFGTVIKSYNSSKKKIKNASIQINTDSILRNNIEKIYIPYWENEYEFSFSNNSITLSWINGAEEKKEIFISNEVNIISAEVLYSANKKAIGLQIRYQIEDIDYELLAAFASIPYGAIKF